MEKRKVTGVVSSEDKKLPTMGGTQLQASIRVHQTPEVCYRYWRDFANLPRFMDHLESVTVMDTKRSHWMVDGPGDTNVEWDAEIIADIPNERISWRSLEKAQIDNAGSVQFSPQEEGRHTDVNVTLTYNPILGGIGEALSHWFGESPEEELKDDLSRFKKMMEGDV